ncbi:hypothetical protein CRI94_13435 [Longibacter salinarum]|uniref:Uncharacterized protein n=1 Tax=Longibacter salinarum TaxID=1850348 RepID=A0A2A8CVA7_9BACT|nr:hypothetical protein [Longibacter salinarum]PEN12524.1 hypothetical protein CRI94_13435 [Longibacter salinarum]
MESMPSDTLSPWWGPVDLDLNTAACWNVGPTTLWAYRTPQDWRILYSSTGDAMQHDSSVETPLGVDRWEEMEAQAQADTAFTLHRHTFRSTPTTLDIQPVSADRSIVVRPEHPLSIPPGEEVTLYLSLPLWIRVVAGTTALEEVPSHRPSDTWFGPSTQEGELCYATKTAGRLRLTNLPLRPHRSVTPLRIRNDAPDSLPLERIHVPAPYLALYAADGEDAPTHLWTQALTLTRDKGGVITEVRIRTGPPRDLEDAVRIQEPRREIKSGLVLNTFRAIEGLLGTA